MRPASAGVTRIRNNMIMKVYGLEQAGEINARRKSTKQRP
jgi:hypothetical protein